MMILARLQVESTRLLNRFCAVLTKKRTGFNAAEADRYLADRQVIRVQMDTPYWPVAEEMAADIGDFCYECETTGVNCLAHRTHTSAAPNPPGAADAPTQDSPAPASGHPDPSPTNASASRAVGGDGPAVDSDIPPVATAGQPTSIGRCGRQAPWNMGPAEFCCLAAGHEGWHRADAGIEWGTLKTPDTTDLNGDPEVELALTHLEIAAWKRRLQFARDAYQNAVGYPLIVPE